MNRSRWPVRTFLAVAICAFICPTSPSAAAAQTLATASSTSETAKPSGAIDGDRFLASAESFWKGAPEANEWWWQVEFAKPRSIGAILQIVGDHPRNLRNAPRRYRWESSLDGQSWRALDGAATDRERRTYRIHRLRQPVTARYARIVISACGGDCPTLREAEFYPEVDSPIAFGDWYVSVSSREQSELSTDPCEFTRLVQQCKDWKHLKAQYLWHGDVDQEFVSAEPRPLCVFLSGSFLEWCQRSREPWRGVQQVLAKRTLPIWGACGGAQVLAILEETGVDQPWDCPRCRDPNHPHLPVYGHIGHTGDAECGDYTKSIAERGKYSMRIVAHDAVLAGLPEEFEIMESHVGQIAYVPPGWVRLVTDGPGAHTENQLLRVKGFPIYAAQFHIELPGTAENSRRIMSNFLSLAKDCQRNNGADQPAAESGAVEAATPK